ncbi:TRAP transporter small permease [Pusillimonas sp. ANT_WB101]|uniref:TRAP transporter small permease n=1 Tax=Pusillimonas sp. ANT_WB101 TaxID=2597356 RepID=UPI0011EFA88A|nr:TRAP transporter small permease subunit [Pusillimonas sp. ANT_WB101]KAA0911421.1 TRAP transporter small permease [Pusillimonas sp. ANT_WB101]
MTFISWLNTHYEDRGPMKALAFFFELVAAIALFALMVLTCIDVIGRYFLNHPVIGASELTKIGLAIVIFAVMPVVTWRGGHIAVDLIDNFLPKTVLRIFAFVSMLIITTSLYFVSIRIWELGARMLRRNITTDFLHIQSGHVLQCIAIFSWLTAISALVYLLLTTFRANPQESVLGAKE